MTPRVRVRHRNRRPIDKPPQQFPAAIKPHAYDESGLGTCLHCGKSRLDQKHIRPHHFEVNLSSTLRRCMCGYAAVHPIHQKVVAA